MSRPHVLTRREVLVAGSTMAATAAFVPSAWGRLTSRTAGVGPGTFTDGVASGEPSADAVTLWSRLTTDAPRSGAEVVVCRDEALTQTVATAVVPTTQGIDSSLKVRVTGLEPSTHYFYKWRSADGESDTGRTKTAPPAGSDQELHFAYASCQNVPAGFFNGYRDATPRDLDLVIFLGDYIYEYAPGDYDSNHVRETNAGAVDLASYRAKYRLYRQDADLRELHRLHPMDAIWDDHEVEDNYTDDDPRPSDLQRTAGYRANFEWLPRMTMRTDRFRLFKTISYGQMADIIFIDERQYRTGQGNNNGGQGKTILGRPQLDWFKQQLTSSRARWKLVANEVQITPLLIAGQPFNTDAWDGFTADRTEVLQTIQQVNASDPFGGNVLFLTGDIHTYEANQVLANASSGAQIATEYVGGSITSPGVADASGGLEATIKANNPWIKQFNGSQHGYTTLDLSAQRAAIEYRVSDITKAEAPSQVLSHYEQAVGTNTFSGGSGGLPGLPLDGPLPVAPTSFPASEAPTRELAARRRSFDRGLRDELDERLSTIKPTLRRRTR